MAAASAGQGSRHWWHQRLSALILAPLGLWLALSIAIQGLGDYGRFVDWVGVPLNAALLACLCLAGVYHAVLGLKVVIEDYVHIPGLKVAAIIAVQLGGLVLVVVALTSVILIMTRGPA